VRLSQRLLEQYDKEMTIVLQYQFWDLKVNETAFEVGLSFDGHPETLVIPFAAIKGFFDPSVQFGLQFDPAAAAPALQQAAPAPVVAAATEEESPEPAGAEAPATGEKVVSLDSFRKKP
jgi:hypothetical protein